MVEPVGFAGVTINFIGPAYFKARLFKARFNPPYACKQAANCKFFFERHSRKTTCLYLPNRNGKMLLLQLL